MLAERDHSNARLYFRAEKIAAAGNPQRRRAQHNQPLQAGA